MAFDHRDGATANPYAPLMGRTFVDLDETSEVTIIDATRATTLNSWVARIIPGDDDWPSAKELDTVGYVDAIIRKAPGLRPVILSGIDVVDRAARAQNGALFSDLTVADQDSILRDVESNAAPEAFSVVLELVYEAYYRAPRVQEVVRRRTGFDVRNTIVGKPMKPFPTERLELVSSRPDNYRSVSE